MTAKTAADIRSFLIDAAAPFNQKFATVIDLQAVWTVEREL
jgi:hypothetical protein